MMDPLSALGIAGNVIQFIDFGVRIIKEGVELSQSADGASDVNRELEAITADLSDMSLDLSSSSSLQRNIDELTKDEKAVQILADQCKTLADKLLSRLEKLKVHGHNKKRESLKQAIRGALKKYEIQAYSSRLDNLQSQIVARLVGVLTDRQSKVSSRLEDLHLRQTEYEVKGCRQIAALKRDIFVELQKLRSAEDQKKDLRDLGVKIMALNEEAVRAASVIAVLQSLSYNTMEMRHSAITEAHAKTFDWVLDQESEQSREIEFMDWLRFKNGIFWITGKPGSGKSTLVKFLCNDPRTTEALTCWAGNKKLVTAHYFFWNPGNIMQKSQQGLLQSLLFNIFQQCPEVIPQVWDERWEYPLAPDDRHWRKRNWTLRELRDTIRRVQTLTLEPARFCFFIDGLDEYAGEPTDIIDIVGSFIDSNDIKVCVSSRPWNAFENAFGSNPSRYLRLHDLTKEAIRHYVTHTLEEDERFSQLIIEDSRCQKFVLEIVSRAQGVFLWVVLVVRSLLRGLGNADNITDLMRRLRILPTDLETYFKHMLDSVENIYHEEGARILQICLAAEMPLDVKILSHFGEEDVEFGVKALIGQELLQQGKNDRIERAVKRIQARCPDLLNTIRNSKLTFLKSGGSRREPAISVEFLHRTVKDFLETKSMQFLLTGRIQRPFEADKFLCQAYLVQAKYLAQYATRFDYDRDGLDDCIDQILSQAGKLEVRYGSTEIAVLDSLEEVMVLWRSHYDGVVYFCEPTWYKYFGADLEYQGPLLPLAMLCGLEIYLQQKLQDDSRLLRAANGDSLLNIFLREREYRIIPSGKRRNILRCLLDHGANPDETFRGDTAWEIQLGKYPDTESLHREFFDEMEIMSSYGASIDNCQFSQSTSSTHRHPTFSTIVRRIIQQNEGSMCTSMLNKRIWDEFDKFEKCCKSSNCYHIRPFEWPSAP